VRMYRDMDDQHRVNEAKRVRQEAEDNARRHAAEQHELEEKKKVMKADNLQILDGIAAQRQRDKEKKQRDAQRMSDWLEDERCQKQKEDQERAVEHAAKCKQARDEMQAAQEAARARKKAQEAAEKIYVLEQVKAMDNAQEAGRAGIKARMAQIERNCATVGKDIADRDAKVERDLQAKVKRVQEQSEREAREEDERRKASLQKRTNEMLASLAVQCKQREVDVVAEKDSNIQQARIWKEQYEQGLTKDRAEAEKRRQARASQDATQINQMSQQLVVHPKNFGITDATQHLDVAYNRLFYEQMHKEGFMPDLTKQMLGSVHKQKAERDANAAALAAEIL